jgi:hypothetical protein
VEFFTARLGQMAVPGPEPFYHLQSGIDAAMRIVEIRESTWRETGWAPKGRLTVSTEMARPTSRAIEV